MYPIIIRIWACSHPERKSSLSLDRLVARMSAQPNVFCEGDAVGRRYSNYTGCCQEGRKKTLSTQTVSDDVIQVRAFLPAVSENSAVADTSWPGITYRFRPLPFHIYFLSGEGMKQGESRQQEAAATRSKWSKVAPGTSRIPSSLGIQRGIFMFHIRAVTTCPYSPAVVILTVWLQNNCLLRVNSVW
jgi:hypothetical protein